MFRTTTIILAASLLQLAACGSDSAATEPMTEQVTGLKTELQEVTELADSHHSTITGATTLAAMATEETAYNTAALAHHDELHHALSEMATCSHSGQPPATTAISELVESIEAELGTHKTNMGSAADVAAAQTEETRHDGVMDKLLADAAAAQAGLASTAADFTCPHHADEAHAH